jgi:hypothetical protein
MGETHGKEKAKNIGFDPDSVIRSKVMIDRL